MTRNLLTINQFVAKHQAFTAPAIRNYIFKSSSVVTSKGTAPGNGFDSCIKRIGRKILLDENKFFQWIDNQNGGSGQ
jgi:hypothetical protein